MDADTCNDPHTGLRYISVVDVMRSEEVVPLDVCRPFLCIPAHPCVNDAVASVIVPLVVRVDVASHAVLESVVQTEVEAAPEVELECADQLVLQVFQGIFAHIAFLLGLVLVDEIIGYTYLPEETLGGEELVEVEVDRCFHTEVVDRPEVHAFPYQCSLVPSEIQSMRFR